MCWNCSGCGSVLYLYSHDTVPTLTALRNWGDGGARPPPNFFSITINVRVMQNCDICEEQFSFFTPPRWLRNFQKCQRWFLKYRQSWAYTKKNSFLVGLSHTILPYICVPDFMKSGPTRSQEPSKIMEPSAPPLTNATIRQWVALSSDKCTGGVELPRGRNLYVMWDKPTGKEFLV